MPGKEKEDDKTKTPSPEAQDSLAKTTDILSKLSLSDAQSPTKPAVSKEEKHPDKKMDSKKAATTIQKNYRRFQTRKDYHIQQLPNKTLFSYETLLIGNDPLIQGLEKFKSKEGKKIAFVGTSGLRSVLLACELANPQKGDKDLSNCPKIFIIDNSLEVHQDWRNLRKAIAESPDEKTFLAKLDSVCRSTQTGSLREGCGRKGMENWKDPHIYYHHPDIKLFMADLFERFGFDFVKRTLSHASLIKQTWQDLTTFTKLNNIIRKHYKIEDTIVYPSNIAFAPETGNPYRLFDSIMALKPTLAIHTNFVKEPHPRPERFILVPNPVADSYRKSLVAFTRLKPVSKADISEESKTASQQTFKSPKS